MTDDGRAALADQRRQWAAVSKALNESGRAPARFRRRRRGMTVEGVEAQISEWRASWSGQPSVNGHDVDELEDHLRQQIADLKASGLADDEAFLIGVKRMGDLDELSREFAREHTGRLWKQLLGGDDSADARIERQFSRRSPSPLLRPSRSRSPGSPPASPTRSRTGSRATSASSCCRSSPRTSPTGAGSTRAGGRAPRCRSSSRRLWSMSIRMTPTPTPRSSSPRTFRSCCGS